MTTADAAPPSVLAAARARAALDAGRPEAAVQYARDALADDPHHGPTLAVLARASWLAGDQRTGADAARQAIAAGHESELMVRLLSQERSTAGDHDGALRLAERCLELDPDEPFAHLHLANVLITSGAARAEGPGRARAIAALEEAVALEPQHPGVLASAARHQLRLDRRGQALDLIGAGLALAPDDADLLSLRATAVSQAPHEVARGMVGVLGADPTHRRAAHVLEAISWDGCAIIARNAGYGAAVAVLVALVAATSGDLQPRLMFWPVLFLGFSWYRTGVSLRKELPRGYLQGFVLRSRVTRVGMALVAFVSVGFLAACAVAFATTNAAGVAAALTVCAASITASWIVELERDRVLTRTGVLGRSGSDAQDTRDDARSSVLWSVVCLVVLALVIAEAATGGGAGWWAAAVAVVTFGTPMAVRTVWAARLLGLRLFRLWGPVS